MEIAEVTSYPIDIPLAEPVSFSNRTIHARDHAITHIRTKDGLEGIGYSLGYEGSSLIAEAVESRLKPVLLGEDPQDTERLWHEMYDGNVQIGRTGLFLRAISTVDIALWDLKAKEAGQPLHKLLGGQSDTVPSYASGGYYRDDKGYEGLRKEMQRYLDEGHNIMKMKVGRRPLNEEIDRVKAVREEIGPKRTLLLDANGVWSSTPEALRACQAFSDYDPYFIEEPVMIDRKTTMGEVNTELNYPVATGELEGTRHNFATLYDTNAAGVFQPDVTVCGGITEWLKIANFASAYDIPIAPHYNWNIHASLLGAIENGLWVEYFYRDMDVKVFDDVVTDPLKPDDRGMIDLPGTPGHGVRLDEEALQEFKQ